MENNIVFCEECRDEVEFSFARVSKVGEIKGKSYSYDGIEAHCKECGSFVYVPSVEDANLKALYDIFRVENGIISLETLKDVPKKYRIGKRPLSLLLGWGEQTLTRYLDGDIPSKEYSETLLRIYNEPACYAELLDKNKDKITLKAYLKSRDMVESLICSFKDSYSTIDKVAAYFIDKCRDITPFALQNALYYVQGFYFVTSNKFLFEDDCEAWSFGPVYPSVYESYKAYRFDPFRTDYVREYKNFSAEELAVCDSVVSNVCCYSGSVLMRFVQRETPWLYTRNNLRSEGRATPIIRKDLISKYFTDVKEKYKIINPYDIKEYTQAMFARS